MNHETAIAMAVVLAVIVITIIYSVISGGLNLGGDGISNLTDRADSENPSFVIFNSEAGHQLTNKLPTGEEERISI